jgi:hypothetical protein
MHILMQDLEYTRGAPQGVTLPEGAVRQEANRINNERLHEQRQRCVEGDVERLLHDTLASAGRDI